MSNLVHARRHSLRKMPKYSFRPDSVHLIPSIPLLVVIAGVSFFSTKTLGTSHGFVDRIACSCMAILVSNLWYLVLTGLQFVNFRLQTLCKPAGRRPKAEQDQKKRGAVVDDRQMFESADDVSLVGGQFSPRALLCGTIEFRHAPREIRLFVSRKEIWYMLYPTSFAIFVLFYCIPIYDVSCSVALITGLLAKSTYDEVQRGIYWKRSTGRKICFAFATICGFVCATGLLVLSSIVTRQPLATAKPVMGMATNASAIPISKQSSTSSTPPEGRSENMIGTLLHGDEYKDAFRRRVEGNSTSNATFLDNNTATRVPGGNSKCDTIRSGHSLASCRPHGHSYKRCYGSEHRLHRQHANSQPHTTCFRVGGVFTCSLFPGKYTRFYPFARAAGNHTTCGILHRCTGLVLGMLHLYPRVAAGCLTRQPRFDCVHLHCPAWCMVCHLLYLQSIAQQDHGTCVLHHDGGCLSKTATCDESSSKTQSRVAASFDFRGLHMFPLRHLNYLLYPNGEQMHTDGMGRQPR